MEPLRKCRTAKFWKPLPGNKVRAPDRCGGALVVRAWRRPLQEPVYCASWAHPSVLTEAQPPPPPPCARARSQMRPEMADPPCSRCPCDLASAPAPRSVPCASCGCMRMTLYDLRTEQLQVPDVCMADFREIMLRTKGSVADKELRRYEDWTREFGQEGG